MAEWLNALRDESACEPPKTDAGRASGTFIESPSETTHFWGGGSEGDSVQDVRRVAKSIAMNVASINSIEAVIKSQWYGTFVSSADTLQLARCIAMGDVPVVLRGNTPKVRIYLYDTDSLHASGGDPVVYGMAKVPAPVSILDVAKFRERHQKTHALSREPVLIPTSKSKAFYRETKRAKTPNTTFWPSPSLIDFLAKKVPESEGLRDAIRQKLVESVLGLLQSIATSRRYAKKSAPYIIGEKGEFVEAVIEALIHTIKFYSHSMGQFLNLLYSDLAAAAPLQGNGWRLESRDGSLLLTPLEDEEPYDAPGPQATVGRSRYGRRFVGK